MVRKGAGALSFWCPLIGILFMAAATDGRNPHRLGPARAARNMAAVIAVLLITALASSLALLPGSLTATLVYPWNEIEPAQPERWLPSLEIIGKALWIGAAYASFGALMVTATGSKIAAGALAIIWALFENIIVDLATGWWSAPWWIDGLLPSNMYIHWQGDPLTTPGSMKNLFGLEDATQAILVLGAHIAVTAAAALALARWKGRRQQGRAETAPKGPNPCVVRTQARKENLEIRRADRPGPRAGARSDRDRRHGRTGKAHSTDDCRTAHQAQHGGNSERGDPGPGARTSQGETDSGRDPGINGRKPQRLRVRR